MKTETDIFPQIWAGLECSVNRVGNRYFNQLESSGHFTRPEDIFSFIDLGIKRIRYPVLWEQYQPQKDQKADFTSLKANFNALRVSGVEIIAGLVHHGSGPPYVNMMDSSFECGLARYAEMVAIEFPWVNLYTPVNEPLTTARFCGLYGLWYPHKMNDRSFCRILINELKATVLAMEAIRKINPDARLVQTDDLGKTHSTPMLQYQADFENNRRWLSFDLLAARVNRDHPLWKYLVSSGIGENELDFFLEKGAQPSVLGFNHYLTSERYLDENLFLYPEFTHGGNGIHSYADVEAVRAGHVCPAGAYNLLKEAWLRYKLPMAVTEVHLYCTREEQMRWLSQVWNTAILLLSEEVDIIAITPWALLGSFDWNSLLTRSGDHYEPGVFDLGSGIPRSTALAKMILAYGQQKRFFHPALLTPGWWNRSCRVLYGTEAFYLNESIPVSLKPVLIIWKGDLFRNEISECCRVRGIYAVFHQRGAGYEITDQQALTDTCLPWAVIYAGALNDPFLPGLASQCEQKEIKLMVISASGDDIYSMHQQDLLIIAPCFDWELNKNQLSEEREPEGLDTFRNLLNSSLDFLIDDEQGIWYGDQNGQLKAWPGVNPPGNETITAGFIESKL